MTPHSNPDSSEPAPEDSPSQDDLKALIPDMELLETSAMDALAAHSAMAAAVGSARKAAPAPVLSDRTAPSAPQGATPQASISDDPYADLMPELEPFDAAAARGIPTLPARPAVKAPAPRQVAPSPKPPAAPRPAAPATPLAPTVQAPPPQARPQPPSAPRPAPRPAPAANGKKLPNPQSVAVPPVMDREFIIRNRIVELYLSGTLPVRGATAFERFCQENPQILDEIGLHERVHMGLRLLEASGKPEPWQEKPKQFWERPYIPIALAGLILVLGIALLVLNRQLAEQSRKVTAMHQLLVDQPLDAAAGTSNVEIQPTHAGPNAAFAVTIGGRQAQLAIIKIDLTHSDFRAFRVTIDRVNQGRVAVLNNLIKDSNGALGFSLNTSALGAGLYQLTIEGLDWRGDPQPDSWAAITIRH
jgi:hypothetical protein